MGRFLRDERVVDGVVLTRGGPCEEREVDWVVLR